jgi:hypothetical protein
MQVMQAGSTGVASKASFAPAALGLAGLAVLLHLGGVAHYGFFRDELYYIACGDHLAWGYVDQPPLIALVARFSGLLFGHSLAGYRILPALAGAGSILMGTALARELGGGRMAQTLTALAILVAPAFLAFGSFLSMNAFEPLLWMTCAYLLLRIVRGGDPLWWLLFGAVAGVGLLNKHTMLLFGFALIVGLLVTGKRRILRSKWPWIAGAIALALFSPNLIWEARHGWPQVEVVRNAQDYKNTPITLLEFLGEQILFLNPLSLPLLMTGVTWLFSRGGRDFRCFGWALVVVVTVVFFLGGKTYYPLPVYPMVIAAGAVSMERWWRRRPLRVYAGALAITGALMAPFGVPLLPVEWLLNYQTLAPLTRLVKMERDSDTELHQLYADMFGWEDIAATVGRVYAGLPDSDRQRCAILAGNYGEAGAIDLFGPRSGLPKAISGHNNYFLWGPRGATGEVVILFGERAESTKKLFGEVELAAVIENRYAAAAERHLRVYVCRHPTAPLEKLWPLLRFYI